MDEKTFTGQIIDYLIYYKEYKIVDYLLKNKTQENQNAILSDIIVNEETYNKLIDFSEITLTKSVILSDFIKNDVIINFDKSKLIIEETEPEISFTEQKEITIKYNIDIKNNGTEIILNTLKGEVEC
jgi:hypothetical protein